MRLAWLRTSVLVIGAFVAGVLASQLAAPTYRQAVMWIAYEQYAELVFQCDNSMREHMLAKQRLSRAPSTDNVRLLEAAEVGLLECQDYDLMRKRLVQWGLRENELSLMGLRAIEDKADSLHRVIEIHEIRY